MACAPRKRTYTPTGRTPQKPKPKRFVPLFAREGNDLSGRKKLTYAPSRPLYTPANSWAEEEDQALTQFVLLSCVGDSWPLQKGTKLWEGASKFLQDTCKTARTSKYNLCNVTTNH